MFPSRTVVAVAASMLNDRLIPITTSYRVVVVELNGGGPVRSSDIVNMEECHDEATENPMYQTYTRVLGNGKGVATALNIAIHCSGVDLSRYCSPCKIRSNIFFNS